MQEAIYQISEAAQIVEVESHVLRYWEEELELDIKRNDQGHRYYTDTDVATFQFIKDLKKQGYQLRAIKKILLEKEGEINILDSGINEEGHQEFSIIARGTRGAKSHKASSGVHVDENRDDKALRLQMLLKQIISEAVREHDTMLCEDIKETMIKELDYQFRVQEEEHFKHLDELLREKQKKSKRKKHSFF